MCATFALSFTGRPVNCAPMYRRRRLAKGATRLPGRNFVQTASFRVTAAAATAATVENRDVGTGVPAGSLYEILRVERTASFSEIKMAYRSLAKMYHPDAAGPASDGRNFIEIRNAYSTLSDPVARSLYDLTLNARSRRVRARVYPTRRWETDQCW